MAFDKLEYIESANNSISKIDLKDRQEIWKYTSTTGNPILKKVTNQGLLLVERESVPSNSRLILIDALTGKEVWIKNITSFEHVIATDEALYILTLENLIKSNLKTGQNLWEYSLQIDGKQWSTVDETFTVHDKTAYLVLNSSPEQSVTKVAAINTETGKEKFSKQRGWYEKDRTVDILWSAVERHFRYTLAKARDNENKTWQYIDGLSRGEWSYIALTEQEPRKSLH